MASRSSKGISRKPQFIRIIYPDITEKMVCKLFHILCFPRTRHLLELSRLEMYYEHFLLLYVSLQIIPARFVKHYVTKECMNSRRAVIFSPLGKFWQIELEKNQSGMFFTGGWSHFLEFHGISKGDILLLRYEGNMVFKFKAFGLSGCQKDFKNQDAHVKIQKSEKKNIITCLWQIKMPEIFQGNVLITFVFSGLSDIEVQQESISPIRKRKSKSSSEENKRQKNSVTSLSRKPSLKKPDYQIGPPCWIRREISTCALLKYLVSSTFGLLERLLSFSTLHHIASFMI